MKIEDVFSEDTTIANIAPGPFIKKKKKKKKEKKLEESLSPVIFHATSLKGLNGMLQTNQIRLSRDTSQRGRYYMSFSRNRNNEFLSYLLSMKDAYLEEEAFNPRKDPFAVLEFDGVKLNQNYAGKAFNTWQPVDGYDFDDDEDNPNFMEDRMYHSKQTIPNARKYINGISIVLNGTQVNSEALVYMIEKYGKNFRIYETAQDYISRRVSERSF